MSQKVLDAIKETQDEANAKVAHVVEPKEKEVTEEPKDEKKEDEVTA
jgi:hypothetical protein